MRDWGWRAVSFVRLALQIVMQNHRDFEKVIHLRMECKVVRTENNQNHGNRPYESFNIIKDCITYRVVIWKLHRWECWIKTKSFVSNFRGKFHPRAGQEGPEREQGFSSTLPSTSALDVGGCSTPRPGLSTPRKKTPYTLYRRLGGPLWRSGRARKISRLPGYTSDVTEKNLGQSTG